MPEHPEQSDSAPPDPTGRERLLRSLRRPGRGQGVAALVLALVGFAGITQVHSNDAADNYAGLRQADLIQVLNGLSAAAQRAENEIATLEQTRNSLRSSSDSRAAAVARARQQATVLGILAGTLPATGPGIRITVKDASGQVGIDEMLNGVEELRDAGAEAIEINDTVRVVAQTSFQDPRGGASGIVVGGRRVQPPYVLDVIGAPETLARALDFQGGFTDEIELANGTVTVQQLDSVEIATVREPRSPEYAQPKGAQ